MYEFTTWTDTCHKHMHNITYVCFQWCVEIFQNQFKQTPQIIAKKIKNNNNRKDHFSITRLAEFIVIFFSLTLFFLFVFFYILILSQKDKLVLLTLKKRSIMHKCSFFLFVLNLLFFLLSRCSAYA